MRLRPASVLAAIVITAMLTTSCKQEPGAPSRVGPNERASPAPPMPSPTQASPAPHLPIAAARPASPQVQSGDGDLLAQLENDVKHLRDGKILCSTPQRMKEGQTALAVARIAANSLSDSVLQQGLPGGQAQVSEPTKISPEMKMRLSSPDFDITPLDSEEQVVLNEQATEWNWDIKPKRSGQLKLTFSASVVLNDVPRDFVVKEAVIAVQVDPVEETAGFVKDNWQWLIATLTAVGGSLWAWLKKRRATAAT